MGISLTECEGKDDSVIVQKSLMDMEYFACLYVRYEQKLLRYIMRLSTFSHAEAEEVLQEVFIKAWENLNEFDQSLKFSSWIYRITHNTTISEWKKQRSHGKERTETMDEELFDNLPSALNLETETDRRLQAEKARKVMRLLPEKYGGILILKFLEDKDYNEISDILKLPAGTVATHISRAKKAFADAARRNNISFWGMHFTPVATIGSVSGNAGFPSHDTGFSESFFLRGSLPRLHCSLALA